MKWLLAVLAAVLGLLLVSGGWSGGMGKAMNCIGSTSVQPFAEMLAQEFNRQGGVSVGSEAEAFVVDVQGGGSTAGIQSVKENVAEIGMCSRSLKAEEAAAGLKPVVIAQDGLAIVVHRSNPVSGLRREDIRAIFAGHIGNWKQVGGDDRPVRLISREEGSGTREAFTNLVMKDPRTKHASRVSRKALTQESNGSVKELVKHDPCAIGYMSLGLVGHDLKMLKVDGVEPTMEKVLAKEYPLVRPFLFVTKGEPTAHAQRFIDYVLSDEAQKMLVTEGLVPAK